MTNKLISVIFATYNENYFFLEKSINSILNQTYKNFELIIVLEPDDINSEYLFKLSKSDERIKIFHNENNLGLTKSLNKALSVCSGNFIARMDSDDISSYNRFEDQLMQMNSRKLDLIASDCNLIDHNNLVLGIRKYSKNSVKYNFLFRNGICHPSVFFKSELISKYGNYNEDFIMSEDLELWLRFLSKKVKMGYSKKILIDYRLPKTSLFRNKKNWTYNFKARYKHIFKIYNPIIGVFSLIVPLLFSIIPNNGSLNNFMEKIYTFFNIFKR